MRQTTRFPRWLLPGLFLFVLPFVGCGGGADELPAEELAAPRGITIDPLEEGAEPLISDEELNRVVAEVNGTPILARKVNEVAALNRTRIEAQGQALTEEDEQELRRTALTLIIDAELIYQAAKQEGITVDPRLVEERVQQARTKFNSEQDYQNYLARARVTEQEVRDEAERRLLVQQFMEQLTGGVTAEESAARALYEQFPEQFTKDEEVRGSYILVKSSPDDPPGMREDARARIDEAYKRIQAGEDFAQIAREYSQAPNAAKGGDLGFFPKGEMVPKFEEMAFNTKIGEVTPIFETPFGFNILKVVDRREPTPIPFEEVKSMLMLQATRQQQNQAVADRLARLREAAEINFLDEALDPNKPGPAEAEATERS